ncbi:MAG: hypothetical protein ISS34_00690 [Candidatus Omnitrophica bacterium]|nr:hypothetical protein [Candidatus Omnitrophota bacterium]
MQVFMEMFLTVASLIFLLVGALFLLSPQTVVKISNFLNLTAFTIDEKMHRMRRAVGAFFLVLSIVLWYIGFPGPR